MMNRLLAATLLSFFSSRPALGQDQQIGARTKAMGGSYTAFEDDPVSVWLNPAGIATQPLQGAIMYNTYPSYELTGNNQGLTAGTPEPTLVEPAFIPGFLGIVWPIGSESGPMALGFAYARPYHLRYQFDEFAVAGTNPRATINSTVEQSFSRFRVAFARSFRFRKPGEAGFFTHLSLGLGLDLSYQHWEMTLFDGEDGGAFNKGATFSAGVNSLGYGGGGGLLAGIYDNEETLRVNLGLAYQSGIHYRFSLPSAVVPAFDMPHQINAGLTFYLLRGMPLRFTADVQWINWARTADDPIIAGQPSFRNALNFSFGAEYRIGLSDSIFLYPRIGYRRFSAPWEDRNNLPMTGNFKLAIDTEGASFHILTFGIGVSVMTAEGKANTFDLAGAVGGDTYDLAFGFTHEF